MTPDDFTREIVELPEKVATTDYQSVLEQLQRPFNAGIEENINLAVNAEGEGWPPRVDDEEHPLLQKTGALLDAATNAEPQFAFALGGTGMRMAMANTGPRSVEFAFVHQFGEEGAGDGRHYPIPQREFFYASAETQDAMEEIVHREVETKLFG